MPHATAPSPLKQTVSDHRRWTCRRFWGWTWCTASALRSSWSKRVAAPEGEGGWGAGLVGSAASRREAVPSRCCFTLLCAERPRAPARAAEPGCNAGRGRKGMRKRQPCPRPAAHLLLCSAAAGAFQSQGELFTPAYFDGLAAEVDEGLQEAGVVALSEPG